MAGAKKDLKADGKDPKTFAPKDRKATVGSKSSVGDAAARQLVVSTCFALGTLGQAIAGSPLVEEFLILLKEAFARPELSWQRVTAGHTPYPPELLALACVSACTKPGMPQEARLEVETPPRNDTDRATVILLCLALGRWESPGSGQHEGGESVSASLKEMIAVQERVMSGRGARGEQDYEKTVMPKLFAGDASAAYQIGPTASQ